MSVELIQSSNQNEGLQISQVVTDMVTYIENLVVDNEIAFKSATSVYRQARDWKNIIEQQRKVALEPYRRRVVTINDKAKELSDPLDRVIEATNAKCAGYQSHLEIIKKQEESKIREAAKMLDIEAPIFIPPMEKSLRGDGAITSTKVEKKFRVTDIAKVPTKYLMVDEKAVKQDLKLGIFQIEGLEIYEEKTTTLRAR
jgi:hypothetical protein